MVLVGLVTLFRESGRLNRIAILFEGVSSVGVLHDQSGQRKYLNAAERKRFRQAIDGLERPHERLFCFTLFFTGCRISEALALTWESVDVSEGTLIFRTLKQRRTVRFRSVPIPSLLLNGLNGLKELRVESRQPLFPFGRTKGWEIVKKTMSAADLHGVKATPKGLRHAYAIACISVNVPLPKLQKWMGHSKLKTTAIYLDYVGDEDRQLARKLWALSRDDR